MEASKNEMHSKNIIFFDGVCHLCNSFVDHLIQADRHRIFYYAPLQGPTAAKLVPEQDRKHLNSVIYLRKGQLLKESKAALQILIDLGGIYKLFGIFKLVPSKFSDLIYRQIAKNRYAWFGKQDLCRLATPEEKSFLLP